MDRISILKTSLHTVKYMAEINSPVRFESVSPYAV